MSDADSLRSLVATMREMGVTHYAKGDTVIDLGPVPMPPAPPITPNQIAKAQQESAAQHEALLFASSEGFPIEDPK